MNNIIYRAMSYITIKVITTFSQLLLQDEPRCEKTGLRGFRPGPTKTGLFSHRRWLQTGNFGFRKQRDCTIQGDDQLLCVFVFAYAKSRFSHDKAHMLCLKIAHVANIISWTESNRK